MCTFLLRFPCMYIRSSSSSLSSDDESAHESDTNPVATLAAVLPMAIIGNFTKVLRKKKKNISARKSSSDVAQSLRFHSSAKFRVHMNQKPSKPLASFGFHFSPRHVAPRPDAPSNSTESR